MSAAGHRTIPGLRKRGLALVAVSIYLISIVTASKEKMRHRHTDREHHHGRVGRRPVADGELQHERGDGSGHHRRRSGRLFDHGELRLVVLGLISERPRHGYEIIKEIEDRVSGSYSPSPGVIYPTLTMLEELGHATVAPTAGGKKLYTVTPEGTAFLDANRSARRCRHPGGADLTERAPRPISLPATAALDGPAMTFGLDHPRSRRALL